MENDFAKHETDYIRQYENLGYTDSYQYNSKNKKLRSTKTNDEYLPSDVTIVKEHRYEGMSNPSDMSLLYVLETSDGSKGTLLAVYGPNADTGLHDFMNAVPQDNVKDEKILPPDADEEE